MLRTLSLLVAMLVASAAAAERRVALVMAAERYDTLRSLANPVNDAIAVEARLQALGFEVHLEMNGDRRRMLRALEDFARDADGADLALVFYSGHGMEVDGENLLLPVDVATRPLTALRSGAVPLDLFADTLATVSDRGVLLIDACRSSPFAVKAGGGRGAAPIAAGLPLREGLARLGRADGLIYAFAAAPGQPALDGEGDNSPFTEALLRHLAQEGLELRSVLTLVQQDVYDRTRGAQLPYVESGLPRSVFLSARGGDLPERERLLLAMAKLTPGVRARIEAVAARRELPLAPLYASYIADGPAANDLDKAADLVADAQQRFRQFTPSDPEALRLRTEAAEALELGAFQTARDLVRRAIEIDRVAADAAARVLVSRRLAEAQGLYAYAEVVYLGGDGPRTYIRAFEEAARVYARADALAMEEGVPLNPDMLLQYSEALGRWQGLWAWYVGMCGAAPDREKLVEGLELQVGVLERLVERDDLAPDQRDDLLGILHDLEYPLVQTETLWGLRCGPTDGGGYGFVEVDRGPFETPEIAALRVRIAALEVAVAALVP